MKKTAAILLFLFAFVQAAPVISACFNDSTVVFAMDEENGNETKDGFEKKDKKDYTLFTDQHRGFSHIILTALHHAEIIKPGPCLEKLTPPPNFS